MDLQREAVEATRLLLDKTVARVERFRPSEVMVEFTDGTRLYVDASAGPVEVSITSGNSS
jgi:hypothetical protein